MKIIIAVFVASILAFSQAPAQVIEDTLKADHYKTKKADIAIFQAEFRTNLPSTDRFTPDKKEVDKAELALESQLKSLNVDKMNQYETPVIDKNLHKYKRQYFGYIDSKGQRILFINCFWKRDKEGELLWLTERIRALEGGSYYWNVKFNLDTNELFDLDVNGNI
jgi:hypothetical protein